MSSNLSINDGVTTVVPGTSDTYTIVVSNTGPTAVTGASVSGRSPDWLKMKNPDAPAVTREAEEDWAR